MPDQGQPSIGHLLRCPLFSLVSYAGHIRYSNLEAKKSFLDSLSVPIGLVRGIVGTLEANVSAASIFSNAPLRITVPSFCPRNP